MAMDSDVSDAFDMAYSDFTALTSRVQSLEAEILRLNMLYDGLSLADRLASLERAAIGDYGTLSFEA